MHSSIEPVPWTTQVIEKWGNRFRTQPYQVASMLKQQLVPPGFLQVLHQYSLNQRDWQHAHSWRLPGCLSSIQKAVSQMHHLQKNYHSISNKLLYINTVNNRVIKQAACADSTEAWKLIEQEDFGRVRTKPRYSVSLGMPYDARFIKGRSQLLGRYFKPVLLSNKMNWLHLYRILVGNFADAWVPELAPRYWDHELNWWMITQNLALNCSN